MEYHFRECTDKPECFFSKLPEDWQEGIVPHWYEYERTARVFIIESESEVLGGGIVFSTISPDTQETYYQEAQRWFDEGYLYIGFLWFSSQHRGKQLGSKWLQQLYANNPKQNFWLAIDEFSLSSFYIRNGFELVQKIDAAEGEEWILTRECPEIQNSPNSFYHEKATLAALA